jgi:hypothetical protein
MKIVKCAQALERELDWWEKSLPEHWKIIVEEVSKLSNINNTCHPGLLTKQDGWIRRGLLHYFCGRLVVNEIIFLLILGA